MKTKQNKEKYLAPAIEVIEVEHEEGVMALSDLSGGNPALPGSGARSNTRSTKSNIQTASPLTDLEDLINDLLTVKK